MYVHAMRFALRWCSGVFARADVVRIVVLGSHDLDAPCAPLTSMNNDPDFAKSVKWKLKVN
jgi:hypothetical protein